MRRVRIQKQRPRGRVTAQLSGGWKPVQDLAVKKIVTAPLTTAERMELEQRTRLQLLIREHAVA
jgi:hypothetical protein